MSTTNAYRDAMMIALKRDVIPQLRARGFRGTFPHFRRARLPRVDYLTFQFNSSGGSFVVELATSEDGKPTGFGSELPVEKLNAHYFRDRHRLGSGTDEHKADHWYHFGPRNYDPPASLREGAFYSGIAHAVLQDFDGRGEQWLQAKATAA